MEPAWDYPVLAAGTAAAGYGYFLENRIASHPFSPSDYHREDIPVYDRWAIGFYSKPLSSISDVLIVIDGLAPLVLNGLELRNGEPRTGAWADLILYGQVVAYASAVSLLSKTSRLHPRPLAYTSKAPLSERESGDARSSFFSEHTTGAFAAAVFTGYGFQARHPESPWVPWVWTGALSVATSVGALRILSGKHFPSDVAAGALAGSLIGYLIPRLHLKSSRSETDATSREASWLRNMGMGVGFAEDGVSPMLFVRAGFKTE